MVNTTSCQEPIENLNVTMTVPITVQRPEWEPDMFIANDEILTVTMETTRGLPILYNVSWGDTTDTGAIQIDVEGSTFYLKILFK
jgi:hypothetical protein